MKEILKMFAKNKKICAVYSTSDEPTNFEVGCILSVSDEIFVMRSIDRYGNDNGFYCEKISNIYRIEENTQYNNALTRKTANHKAMEFNQNSFLDILKHLLSNKEIATIELLDDRDYTVVGYVKSIENDIVRLSMVDRIGKYDGEAYFEVSNISAIYFGSKDENKLMSLSTTV